MVTTNFTADFSFTIEIDSDYWDEKTKIAIVKFGGEELYRVEEYLYDERELANYTDTAFVERVFDGLLDRMRSLMKLGGNLNG